MSADPTPPTFVVRTGGAWWLTLLRDGDQQEVDLGYLLAESSDGPASITDVPPLVGVGVDAWVEPFWAYALERTDGPWSFESGDGRRVRLDHLDMRILDAVGGTTRVAALIDTLGDGVVGRLAALCATGILRVATEPVTNWDDGSGDGTTGSAHSDTSEVTPPQEPAVRAARSPAMTEMEQTARTLIGRAKQKLGSIRGQRGEHADPGSTDAARHGASGDLDHSAPVDGRIPVYAIWHDKVDPPLSLGMLLASARAHDNGALNETFELRRIERAEDAVTDLRRRSGPAILLCSNYVWSLDENLATARRMIDINPELTVLHGGPSTPKFAVDNDKFLDDYGWDAPGGTIAHVLTLGEGEDTICELLDHIAAHGGRPDYGSLDAIAGIAYREPGSTTTIRTKSRERIADLDRLPSPYLTGEFDHIEPEAWVYCQTIETNRGCPYGCTFCDWGSSTLSRLRMFDIDRVVGEFTWAANHLISAVVIADSNFGIMSRDAEITERFAAVKEATGRPAFLSFTTAKNTTKHLLRIMDDLQRVDLVPSVSMALQTIDPDTLNAVKRKNLPRDEYLSLAANHRRRGHPVQNDLLIGLPEQTYETFKTDLQFSIDHEIQVKGLPLQLLPNAPMNDPAYKALHGIETNDRNIVVAARSFTREDRAEMLRIRRAYVIFDVFGLLRHVLRWVQWEHDIRAIDVLDRILTVATQRPTAYPHLSWLISHFDLHTVAPAGWSELYSEAEAFLAAEFGIESNTELDTVLALNKHLMPSPAMSFPRSIDLEFDYPAYYFDATASLYTTGEATGSQRPLSDYPPTTFTVAGDPLNLCTAGPGLHGNPRDEVIQGDFYMGVTSAFELDSPLMRMLPFVTITLSPEQARAHVAHLMSGVDQLDDGTAPVAAPVATPQG